MNWFKKLLARFRPASQHRPDPPEDKPVAVDTTGLPKFAGRVFVRDGSEEYTVHAYQYATTSEPEGTMTPAVIVFVADDDDIKLAIQYAVRTTSASPCARVDISTSACRRPPARTSRSI